MIAVLDANAVIGLAKGECLDHVRSLFREVLVSSAVRREVLEEGRGRAGARELRSALGDWIQERNPGGQVPTAGSPGSGAADQELLGLALEREAVLVSDDAVLRREARGVEIPILGTTEVVLLMKQQGLLGAIKPVLDLMQARGYQIEAGLYAQALSVAGEE